MDVLCIDLRFPAGGKLAHRPGLRYLAITPPKLPDREVGPGLLSPGAVSRFYNIFQDLSTDFFQYLLFFMSMTKISHKCIKLETLVLKNQDNYRGFPCLLSSETRVASRCAA